MILPVYCAFPFIHNNGIVEKNIIIDGKDDMFRAMVNDLRVIGYGDWLRFEIRVEDHINEHTDNIS